MVGQIEGQFLTTITKLKGAKRVLDIGTFTGYSALAFADGFSKGDKNGKVVTIENDEKVAEVAQKVIASSPKAKQIELIQGDAKEIIQGFVDEGKEKFDIVFLDADKVNYKIYYELGLKLLEERGVLIADNAMCSLVYGDEDPARKALHEFNKMVREDERVEQVLLTVREGILMVQKKEGVQ